MTTEAMRRCPRQRKGEQPCGEAADARAQRYEEALRSIAESEHVLVGASPIAIVMRDIARAALAAFDLLNDARNGRLPASCPECGQVMVLAARQHRDRLCEKCALERKRANWRRSKQKTARATSALAQEPEAGA